MSSAINLNTKRMQFPFVLKECLIWNFSMDFVPLHFMF